MQRLTTKPRADFRRVLEEQGMLFHTTEGVPYWNEGAYYAFSLPEIERIERVSAELNEMCIAAVGNIIEKQRYPEFGIPSVAIPLIEHSWEHDAPSLYDRFDLWFDGVREPKLLENNADTPTSLLEAAVIQWQWFEDTRTGSDQYNSLHERLVAKWRLLKDGRYLHPAPVHFACIRDSLEDRITVGYLMETALQAGFDVIDLDVRDIGYDSRRHAFVDAKQQKIENIFKLYPWEWMFHEEFAQRLEGVKETLHWMEPAWNVLLANKGMLAVLWELYPDHPNLLPTYLGHPHDMKSYAKKPLFSREGANVTLVRDGTVVEQTGGDYGEEGYVYQELCELPSFESRHPVIGAWLIDGEPAGMGIRESRGAVTDDTSQFVCHVIR
jgi:glutathionylspermidine synthase